MTASTWDTNNRKQRLPPDWQGIRRCILDRDQHRCMVIKRDGTRCWDRATDVHHLGNSTDHRDEALALVCQWRHCRLTPPSAMPPGAGRATSRLRGIPGNVPSALTGNVGDVAYGHDSAGRPGRDPCRGLSVGQVKAAVMHAKRSPAVPAFPGSVLV